MRYLVLVVEYCIHYSIYVLLMIKECFVVHSYVLRNTHCDIQCYQNLTTPSIMNNESTHCFHCTELHKKFKLQLSLIHCASHVHYMLHTLFDQISLVTHTSKLKRQAQTISSTPVSIAVKLTLVPHIRLQQ